MTEDRSNDSPRGRRADKPGQISGLGWLDIAWRVKREMSDDNITMLAAGVAFYALLAVFPALAAIISIWALVLDPYDITRQISELGRFIPPGAASVIEQQANEISENTDAGLSVAALVSLVVAMFVASKGVRGLILGLNIVYGEQERRRLAHKVTVVSALTVGLIVLTLVTIAFIAGLPLVIGMLGLDSTLVTLISLLRWPVLVLMMMLVIAVLYRFGPYRRSPRWEWLSVGTVTATLLWLLGSLALSFYVSHFANFSELYGSLGAVVVLLMWFWLSAFTVLVGAELNGEMERQTRHDTTVGEPRPMGERGAHAADTLGKSHSWRKR
ncbi:YihY/virulence factor BrkB family protein [Franzmannia qiaohouensis]|uniref:YihY/virulence factor BrkB family protein n=1 Tax=Franzmannia qiaohouensis TaxID=1329370 RepID=A0ABU1HCL8_9GAMM|nr:YihY/virulence factor BrkB family protein [Halomonas qiaohouensis]MDR5905223.1 YihY/virulence factor BrkB family protein [Halomonas qiaohouensis]